MFGSGSDLRSNFKAKHLNCFILPQFVFFLLPLRNEIRGEPCKLVHTKSTCGDNSDLGDALQNHPRFHSIPFNMGFEAEEICLENIPHTETLKPALPILAAKMRSWETKNKKIAVMQTFLMIQAFIEFC